MRIAGSTAVVITVAFTLLLLLLLLVPMPESGREWSAAFDFAHAPVFAILTVLLMGGLRRRWARNTVALSIVVWLGATGFGLLTEFLQGLVGRHPSWLDVRADALGAAAGILWVLGRSAEPARWRVGLLVGGGVLLALAAFDPLLVLTDARRQRAEMPLLSSFEHALEMSRWAATDSRIQRTRMHATDGLWSLRVDLQPAIYPGSTLEHPYGDWSGHEAIAFDVFLDGPSPLDLIVKIEDVRHNYERDDRFERRVRLLPGMQRVRIALSDVAAAPRDRTMDLSRVSRLQFFAVRLTSPRTIFLDNVHLR